ncbi:hypothetical protein I6A60_05390 [Frankia sp. AgB1.9]|uniref:hypothetical protein n=1 Tax=unclassified Frankia TaxID=2632575 RepID=UPI00193191AB|nr:MULTISPECIES: hypothetical protein [unclassified Frankia]MBL7489608.1 hypothetical protein [Frankia sp. AgW1.1]MBL7547315.1 hypothetical protein [Frankia sp. AgB1.9]MBL7618714.1 hypothetical protein [Frankia sp. AgB1.8]
MIGGTAVGASGFRPSTSAFQFTNDFPHQPVLAVRIPGLGKGIPIGDASRGLCGGMIFAVRDLFEARREPPPDTVPPGPGSPLYRYIVRRLFDSWDLPRGALRYYRLQATRDADVTWALGRRPGLGRITVVDEWPRVRTDLDSGRLPALGIITVHSADPLKLGLNHQVLAYGYDLVDTTVTLRVYDPNTPLDGADDVALSFDVANPAGPVPITHNLRVGGRPVRGFFHSTYRWADPAAIPRTPGDPATPANP